MELLAYESLIYHRTTDSLDITSEGILYTEEQNIGPAGLISENWQLRSLVLDLLAEIYEAQGPKRATLHLQDLLQETGAQGISLAWNLQLLEDQGYVEKQAIGYRITPSGLSERGTVRPRQLSLGAGDIVTASPSDIYATYEAAMRQLLERLGDDHPRYIEALVFQGRLTENIAQTRSYGDTDSRKADRHEILGRLNDTALSILGISFNDLCQGL